jgi:asparagine synthase (glutamine-hydrolysing)
MYRAAAHSGARVFLDGIDGDSVVSDGIDRLCDLARTFRWIELFRESRALSRRASTRLSPARIAWMYGFKPILREPALTASQKHAAALEEPFFQFGMELSDRAAAAFSIEARYPFFDRRLVELSLSIPAAQKLAGGWPRLILRQAMQGVLPPEVQWRFTKSDLSPNFYRGLLTLDRPFLERLISEPPPALAQFLDPRQLQAAFRRCCASPVRNEADAVTIYTAVVLARWLSYRTCKIAASAS